MKIEVGKTYLTRDGDKAVVLCVDAPNKQPVIVLHDDGEASNHRADGGFFPEYGQAGLDLVSEYVEPPKPREVWVRIQGGYIGHAFTDAEKEGLMSPETLVKFREVIA